MGRMKHAGGVGMRISNPEEISIDELIGDRDRLEQLVAEYTLLSHTVEKSPLPYAIFDKDNCLVAWNKSYEVIHASAFLENREKAESGKLSHSEITSLTASDFLEGAALDSHLASCKDQQYTDFNQWHDRWYGEHGWYRVIKFQLPNGEVAGLATDISELKTREIELEKAKAQAELAQSKFSEAISVLDDGFVIFDEEDRLVTCNDAFRKQFADGARYLIEGNTYREMTLELAHSGIIPGVEGKEEEFVDGLIKKRRSEEGFTHTFQRHDGIWIRQRDKRTPSGQLIGVRTDITELKERELEIEKTSKRFSETTEAMAQGLVVLEDEIVTMYNSKILEILELDESILFIGQTLEGLITMQVEQGCFGERSQGISYEAVRRKLAESNGSYRSERSTRSGKIVRVDGVQTENGSHILTFTDVSELNRRERELETTSKRLRTTIDAMAQGIIVFEHNRVVMFNQNALEILEIDEEILFEGQEIHDFLAAQQERGCFGNQEIGEKFVEKHTRLIAQGEPYQLERRTISGKYLRVDGAPGENNSLILTFTDVSSTKTREQEFEKTSQLFMETTEAMSQGMLVFGEETIEFYNERAEEMLGVPGDVLFVGGYWRDFLEYQLERGDFGDKETAREYVDSLVKKIENRIPYEIERRSVSNRILRANGAPSGSTDWLVTFTDITGMKAREAEIQKTSQLLQGITDAMIQGMLVFGETNIEFVNPQARRILGVPENVLAPGMPWRDLLRYQIDRGDYGAGPEAEAKLEAVIKHIESRKAHHIERRNHDGRDLRVDGSPLGTEGWIATYTDISDLKAREKSLEEAMLAAEAAERAKSEFLANMSHEIRTPMNGVMGMAELLATTDLDSKQRMFTDVIVKSGASLLTIINDILDFSKIDAGQMELDPAPFTLAEAIEDVATLVSSKVAEKDLELIVRIDPSLPKTVVGDVGRIRQIITNLLGNAVKFTDQGHVYINVSGETHDQGNGPAANLHFSVEDTGIGIPQEDCERVFQKFSQVDCSATRKHEGTGLGLSIASSLVELMGGEIGVTSEVGKGTTFWFTASLPIEEEHMEITPIPGDLSGARILVVDDNEVNRAILMEQMTAWNFDSATASSGREGLEIMRAAQAGGVELDLVILDFQMPEMTGADVLEEIRNDPALKHTPVLMLTSVDSSQVTKRFNELGAEANLTKPTRSSLLLETITHVISVNRAGNLPVAKQDAVSAAFADNTGHHHEAGPADVAETAPMPPETPLQPVTIGDIPGPQEQPEQPSAIEVPAVEHGPLESMNETPEIPVEAVQAPPGQLPVATESGAETRTEQLDILVAEDNEVNQIVVRQILEETGASFEIYENGRLALEAFKAAQPRMVLMDVSMPEMNGKEATIAIRQFEEANNLARTPIVGVTAHALKGDKESCLEVGMDDYLSKPVSPNRMVEKVNQWLQHSKKSEQVA